MGKALNCLVCKKDLDNMGGAHNQPLGGLAFSTGGHYGTRVFDPMDGSAIEINICDECLVEASEAARVMRYCPNKKAALWDHGDARNG